MTELNKEKDVSWPKEGRVFSSLLGQHDWPDRTAHLIFWPILIIGFAVDLWSKSLIFKWLQLGESYPVINGFFQLTAVQNAGAAFGLADGQRILLVSVSAVASIVILGLFFFGGIKKRLAQIAIGLFIAGVLGNLYDRIFNDGLVRDFIDITYWPGKHWPAFNIADSMLCIAVGLLIITSLHTTGKQT
ncbi:MAG: signal peptidase II [Planctomycetota bacterium]